MNKRQKEVYQAALHDEQVVMKRLESNYTSALARIRKNIKELQANPLTQSKIYQLEYQKQLEAQISGILDTLQGNNFTTIADYLNTCYQTGFIGTAYDWQGQGVPLTIPIDQRQVIKAVQKTGDDFKLSNKLGVNTKLLKEQVKTELQRGIAAQFSYADIARNITDYGQSDMNRSILIARTEGHRVQNDARMDAMQAAKKKGADIVKEWDSTLDGNTRPNHRLLDGQIKELDEPFEVSGMKVNSPGSFGIAAEDCNCRCCVLQRARWALKEKVDPNTGEVTLSDKEPYQKWNNQDGGFIKCSGFKDFEQKYLQATQPSVTIKGKPSNGAIKTLEDCKTPKEVESLMKSQGWFNSQTINGQVYDTNATISLDGCDLETAKAIYESHQLVFDHFPQLVGKLNSITTGKISPRAYAQCSVGFGRGGVTVNNQWFNDSNKIAKQFQRDVTAGFHPPNTTYRSIVTHELGHAVDDYLTNVQRASGMVNHWKPKWVSADLRPKVMRSCKLKVSDAYTEVSGYATKDHFEWFAECFAEYMESPTPRKVATEFGKQLEILMKGVK